MEPDRPLRGDLARGDQLGSLLDEIAPPPRWYADELLDRAAKVLARSDDGGPRLGAAGATADQTPKVRRASL